MRSTWPSGVSSGQPSPDWRGLSSFVVSGSNPAVHASETASERAGGAPKQAPNRHAPSPNPDGHAATTGAEGGPDQGRGPGERGGTGGAHPRTGGRGRGWERGLEQRGGGTRFGAGLCTVVWAARGPRAGACGTPTRPRPGTAGLRSERRRRLGLAGSAASTPRGDEGRHRVTPVWRLAPPHAPRCAAAWPRVATGSPRREALFDQLDVGIVVVIEARFGVDGRLDGWSAGQTPAACFDACRVCHAVSLCHEVVARVPNSRWKSSSSAVA
jgi:hypothetical protein